MGSFVAVADQKGRDEMELHICNQSCPWPCLKVTEKCSTCNGTGKVKTRIETWSVEGICKPCEGEGLVYQ